MPFLLFSVLLTFSFQLLYAEDNEGNESFGLVIEADKPDTKTQDLTGGIKKDSIDIKAKDDNITPWESAVEQSLKFKKQYKARKATAITFIALGVTAFLTGTGIISTGQLITGAPLMFSGLTLISAGLVTDSSANYRLKVSEAYERMSTGSHDNNMSAMEYYNQSGISLSVKKNSSRDLRLKGIVLTSTSVPLIIASIGCFIGGSAMLNSIDRSDDEDESMDEGLGEMGMAMGAAMVIVTGIAAIVPGVIILSGGITLLSMSSKWSRLNPKAGIVTLNSIAPVIDPVSKTYGLSMGFSF